MWISDWSAYFCIFQNISYLSFPVDLALRCLVRLCEFRKMNLLQASSPAQNSPSLEEKPTLSSLSSSHPPIPLVKGIVVALCCHHCCDWKQFVGREFFTKRGFTPIDFYLLTHMSSWGVCGVRPGDKINTREQSASVDASSPESSPGIATIVSKSNATSSNSAVFPSRIPTTYIAHPKETIGLKCKRLLDIARLEYLRAHGFTSKLVYYVDKSVSLENVLLLAIPMK